MMLVPNIEDNWINFMEESLQAVYFSELLFFLNNEYKTKKIYPLWKDVFNAFEYCSLDELKIVILGQDPYHGHGQANGLCFSVNQGHKIPPSLKNIYKELHGDLGIKPSLSGDLNYWARQGVLLLNSILTVEANVAGSHQNKGWELFTDSIIKKLSDQKKDLIFMLWGNFAMQKTNLIDVEKHHILKAAHPSPFSANRGFLGCKHFSQANAILMNKQLKPIDWNLNNYFMGKKIDVSDLGDF